MTEQPQIPVSVPSAVEVQPAPVVAATPVPEAPRVVLGNGTDVTDELTKMREAAHEAVSAQRVVLEDGNDVTDGIEPDGAEEKKPRMKRRDLLAVAALLRRNKLDPTDLSAMGLGIQYLQEKRSGETPLSFQAWLDEDLPESEDDEDGEDGFDEDGNPTQP